MGRSLSQFGITVARLEHRPARECLAQEAKGIEVLRHTRAARFIGQLPHPVALDHKQPTRPKRLPKALEDLRTKRRIGELEKYRHDQIGRGSVPRPVRNIGTTERERTARELHRTRDELAAANEQLHGLLDAQQHVEEQERKRIAMMSPAQKEAYARAKAQAKKAEHDRQVAAENTKQYIIAGVIIAFLAVAGSIVVGLLMRMH